MLALGPLLRQVLESKQHTMVIWCNIIMRLVFGFFVSLSLLYMCSLVLM